MNSLIKWIGFVAAIIAIGTFVYNLFGGWPSNHLLTVYAHKVEGLVSTPEFKVESLRTSSGEVLNPGDKFSYKFDIPLDVRGTTQWAPSDHVWVVLKDEHGGYYLQNSPVEMKGDGNWTCYNIRPLQGIKQVLWIMVNDEGSALFERKRCNSEWGKFTDIPSNSQEVAYATLR